MRGFKIQNSTVVRIIGMSSTEYARLQDPDNKEFLKEVREDLVPCFDSAEDHVGSLAFASGYVF